jgi:uncharacterized protein (DUF433 family)
MTTAVPNNHAVPVGIGFYTVADAARLLKIPAHSIHRWLGGYHYGVGRERVELTPLWTTQIPAFGNHIELGFRDLIELRFVAAFLEAGLTLRTVRRCIEYARNCVQDERPFSTSKFKTDGRTIFFESASGTEDEKLLDLKTRQYNLKAIIQKTFKDLDIEADAVKRWRPFNNKESIVIDPARAFGQPIAARYGVPTVSLAEAVAAEGSAGRVARCYEVPVRVVQDAIDYEHFLQTA